MGRLNGSIDLQSLTLAISVSKCSSMRLAALDLGLTAPGLSRRIRALEDVLGVSLFERRSSGVRTTEAGARFLDAAAQMLSEMEDATDQAREAGSAKVGRLVIGTYFSASAGRLRNALLSFIKQNRTVRISMMEACRRELVGAVRQAKADVALILGPAEEPGLARLGLWQEVGMVALPEGHQLNTLGLVQWAKLSAETFLVSRRGSGPEMRETIRALFPMSNAVRFVEHDVGQEGMFNLVGAGLGVAALTESASGVKYPGVRFRPVGDERGPTMIEVAAYYDPRRDNPVLRRFLATLRAAQRADSSPAVPY